MAAITENSADVNGISPEGPGRDAVFTDNILFRKIIENSYEGISLLNRDLKVIYRSPSAERITGWSWRERLKEETLNIIHEEDLPGLRKLLNNLMAEPGATDTCTFRSLHSNGIYVWLECTFSNLLHESGIEAVVCNFRDITAKKQADELLQQTLQELIAYKYAIDESAIVAITDQKGIIKHVNDNFCKISGYSADELVGQDHRIINSTYHDKSYIKNLWHTIANGHIWRGELKNKAKNGQYYWVDTTIVPFLDDKHKPYQYVAIRSDITERKEGEMQLIALNQGLEKQKKELEISNEELEQFAYVASHDLQEPLRMITSFLTLLDKKYSLSLDEKAKQYIYYAVDGAKRMRQIILDLLQFSRVGRADDDMEAVDIKEILDDIIHLFSKQIAERNALIAVSNMPTVFTYKAPLRVVFQNLISNSLKYQKDDSPPRINIDCKEYSTYWLFSVADNGIGIDPEYYNRIFIIFQRLHNKDKYHGTGMGLAVTKKTIEHLGGRIWVESAEGDGSTFYFTLPKDQNL